MKSKAKRQFKVGDRVIVIKTLSEGFKDHVGRTGYIKGHKSDNEFTNVVNFPTYGDSNWADEELKLDEEYSVMKLLLKIDENG